VTEKDGDNILLEKVSELSDNSQGGIDEKSTGC
jgi:hypothetical protein